LIPKTKIEIICHDEDVNAITNIIITSAKTGDEGDGKIFIYDVADIYRIRNGEKGGAAL